MTTASRSLKTRSDESQMQMVDAWRHDGDGECLLTASIASIRMMINATRRVSSTEEEELGPVGAVGDSGSWEDVACSTAPGDGRIFGSVGGLKKNLVSLLSH